MKIAAAQIACACGLIGHNIARQVAAIHQAADAQVQAVFFPELSLTGYQPALAARLAIETDDVRLDVFQSLSDRFGLLIATSAPLRVAHGVAIALFVFQPHRPRTTYTKQHLHEDERSVFTPGHGLRTYVCANQMLAPAICYESLQSCHAQQAAAAGATLYFTSVAKSSRGVAAAYSHYPEIARTFGMAVVMANCVGATADYVGAGGSAAWDASGELIVQADGDEEALVIYDSRAGTGDIVGLCA